MLAVAIALASQLAGARAWSGAPWTASWGAAPTGAAPDAGPQVFAGQTVRLIVRTSIGGNRVRIRLSNEFGAVPLRVGAAHIGLRAGGSDVAAGTGRALTFGGRASVTIAPGAPALSDPVDLHIAPLAELAVSIYLPGTVPATTMHATALQTSYVSPPGDYSATAALPVQRTLSSWPFLTGVEVQAHGAAIVILGDSMTDSAGSTPDSGNRWPDWLAWRLQAERQPAPGHARIAVVNRGISGNRLLSNAPEAPFARSALERFDRDVLATPGVRYLALLIGIQDIGSSSAASPVTLPDLVAGYRQLIARARAKGIAVMGATLPPFEGAGIHSPEKDALRRAVNEWIRNHDEFDAVADIDRALRDPARASRLLPAYDSGDHLHPNQLGYQAMANAVPLGLFQGAGQAALQ